MKMLSISAQVMGKTDTIHPTLIWDEKTAILVDTGYPRQLPQLREAIEKCGIPLQKLDKIILTHQDIDHIGNLQDLVKKVSQKVEVLTHAKEKPFIEGEKQLLKVTPEAIAQIDTMLKDVPAEWREGLKKVLKNPPSAPVDRTIAGKDELPFCSGITVIDTPGHVPGHISLYLKESKTLIAGDAMVVRDGQLYGPDPEQTLDMDMAIKSIGNLKPYDIQTVICYHGGLYEGQANERIAELAIGQ
ncbi:MAG TPA: MBL fold metallo-hydrolase [Bacillales bacterium]|nr:MBL fold metallo-hydrolase [Bacillales bacterium]